MDAKLKEKRERLAQRDRDIKQKAINPEKNKVVFFNLKTS